MSVKIKQVSSLDNELSRLRKTLAPSAGRNERTIDVRIGADAFDDEFDSSTLDPSWTVVAGASGTVDFDGNGAPGGGNGVYDLTTRPGVLLMQGDDTEEVQIRKPLNLAVGESIIMCISSAAQNDSAVNNAVTVGLSVNDSTTSRSAGNSISIFAVETNVGSSEIRTGALGTWTGSNVSDTKTSPVGIKVYLRISRISSTRFVLSHSRDGFAWKRMTDYTGSDTPTHAWIFNQPAAANPAEVPIQAVDWIRKGSNDLEPWEYGEIGGRPTDTAFSIAPIDIKRAADAFDDEFTSSTLDPSWTAVTGSSGTVIFEGNGAPGSPDGVFDLATRPGWLLMQGNNGEHVELRKDRTLQIGESYVACVSSGGPVQNGTNNEIAFGISINDSDVGYEAGNSIALYVNEHDGGAGGNMEIQTSGFGSYSVLVEDTKRQPSGSKVYLRILRTSTAYRTFYSLDGTSWAFMGSQAVGDVADNFWVFNHPAATATGFPPVMAVDWVRLGTSDVDPWPLIDGSTTQPTVTGQYRGALLTLSTNFIVGTAGQIEFDTVEEDTDNFFNISNPTRFTIPNGVTRIRLSGNVQWSGGTDQILTTIIKNGSQNIAGIPNIDKSLTVGIDLEGISSYSIPVQPGDFFEIRGESNGSITANGGNNRTWFGIEVIEPVVAITDQGSLEISDAESPKLLPTTVRTIYADTTNGTIELDLPTVVGNHGLVYEVKIIAGANSVSLDPNGTENIEGSSTSLSFSGVLSSRVIKAKGIGSNQGWWVIQ